MLNLVRWNHCVQTKDEMKAQMVVRTDQVRYNGIVQKLREQLEQTNNTSLVLAAPVISLLLIFHACHHMQGIENEARTMASVSQQFQAQPHLVLPQLIF